MRNALARMLRAIGFKRLADKVAKDPIGGGGGPVIIP